MKASEGCFWGCWILDPLQAFLSPSRVVFGLGNWGPLLGARWTDFVTDHFVSVGPVADSAATVRHQVVELVSVADVLHWVVEAVSAEGGA